MWGGKHSLSAHRPWLCIPRTCTSYTLRRPTVCLQLRCGTQLYGIILMVAGSIASAVGRKRNAIHVHSHRCLTSVAPVTDSTNGILHRTRSDPAPLVSTRCASCLSDYEGPPGGARSSFERAARRTVDLGKERSHSYGRFAFILVLQRMI